MFSPLNPAVSLSHCSTWRVSNTCPQSCRESFLVVLPGASLMPSMRWDPRRYRNVCVRTLNAPFEYVFPQREPCMRCMNIYIYIYIYIYIFFPSMWALHELHEYLPPPP